MGTTLASGVALYGLAAAYRRGELESMIPGLNLGNVEKGNKASAH